MEANQSDTDNTSIKPIKRALAISGGGPTLGIAIGALEALQENGIRFDVYSCACIGSWVACIYLSKDGTESKAGIDHLKKIYQESFRPDDVYSSYPFAYFFQPDITHYITSLFTKALTPSTYKNLFLPPRCMEFIKKWMLKPALGVNDMRSLLNDLYPLTPLLRLFSEIIFKSALCGIVNQPAADEFAKGKINFEMLRKADPFIYTNAYNFEKHDIEMFTNKERHEYLVPSRKDYKVISAENLMAGSSLPYIYEPRCINGKWYCEGATVDTVNFQNLLNNHPDLDEVWVLKIVDYKQLKRPTNLVEGLSTLPMIFADTAADDDIKLFRYHLLEQGKLDQEYEKAEYIADNKQDEYAQKVKGTSWPKPKNGTIKLVTIQADYEDVNFDWDQSNLIEGIKAGAKAAKRRIATYLEYR